MTAFSSADHRYMAEALRLAERGLTTTMPNPRVGCIIVKGEQVVGEGWHQRVGEPHAEIHALVAAADLAQGAVAYVTLEPCAHTGRTPPCCQALIASGVQRVVVAMIDPNPLVAGRGIAALRAAGITVDVGLLETAAQELNVGFVSRMTRGRPWLRLKTAISLDGKTALNNGQSQWITGEAARQDAHHWRARSCAVLTGIGTVLSDDPQLTVRALSVERQPWRVIVDRALATPVSAKVLTGGGTLIFTASRDAERHGALSAQGVQIKYCPSREEDRVDLHKMLQELAAQGCNEVLLEAGASLNGALLDADLVDELLIYQAPILLGERARGMALLQEINTLAHCRKLQVIDTQMLGSDTRIRARVQPLVTL